MLCLGLATLVVLTLQPTLGAANQTTGPTLRVTDPRDAFGPLDIAAIKLRQRLGSLSFALRSRGNWGFRHLQAQPPATPRRDPSVCLFLKRSGRRSKTRICLPRSRHQGVGVATLGAGGTLKGKRRERAKITRDGPNKAAFEVSLRRVGLKPGRYSVDAVTDWNGASCGSPEDPLQGDRCLDRVPDQGGGRLRIAPLHPVGCVARHPRFYTRGSANTSKVALTFDDGPSTYTPKVLSILRRYDVHATFFEVGQNVSANPSVSRAVIAGGNELADHSLRHESKPGYSSMAATKQRIEAAAGFEPCLFRPPYGAYDSRVVGDAASLGMATINWDVDPVDWSRPGTGAIISRVLSRTRKGSIVLMHDGGGDRSQTVAALPAIIRTLQHRGYKLVTVSKLLGNRTRFALGPGPRARVVPARRISEPPVSDLGR